MDIKILDSDLRKYLKTTATPKTIAEKMSLASVSIERIEPYKDDFIYTIEVTTNRPDLASVIGIAREAGAVLPQAGIDAVFSPPTLEKPKVLHPEVQVTIQNHDQYIYRVCAVVMEVSIGKSSNEMQDSLEAAGIRSLNNLIDITNYVMRIIGHPTHVFDYDRLGSNTLSLRESKKGEKITTLDGKIYTLPGGDLVADNGKTIVDLLGIMGLENSVVTNNTKRILFFIDNNDPLKMRKTSMQLGIRTEAVQLNEKAIDPYLAYDALLFGIQLYKEQAAGKIISEIIDIFPYPPRPQTVSVDNEHVSHIMGVSVPLKTSVQILKDLGFETKTEGTKIITIPPSSRGKDILIEEDLIEEIARVYGYHNIPTALPPLLGVEPLHYGKTGLFWEKRVKDMMKYYGFTEVYTYSMVSEELYEGPIGNAVKIKNYLTEDMIYMRQTIVPNLLQTIRENKARENFSIFEIANVYEKNTPNLPTETRMFAAVIKERKNSFFKVKGLIEQMFSDIGIRAYSFQSSKNGGNGASIFIEKQYIGDIETLDTSTVDFELNFELLCQYASLKKIYVPPSKYPPIIEDLAFIIDEEIHTEDVIKTIKRQSGLIHAVSLLDRYNDSRTFHILYQDKKGNLTNEDAGTIRTKIINSLKKEFSAKLKD